MTKHHLIALPILACLSAPALSHPHVFVEMQNQILLTPDGKIKGMSFAWSFDDAYAAVALEGMDADGDGKYSSEELKQLTEENLSSIADYGYFTTIRQNGMKLALGNIGASSQTFENGKLRLSFELFLQQPADPKVGEVVLKNYDSEFFIAFDYAKSDPVKLSGTLPVGCKLDVRPLPSGEQIEQTRMMLSDKPKDWKPEQEEDFGALFAQPVAVICAP